MTYTVRLIGGPRGGRTLRLGTFFGREILVANGRYVLQGQPPTIPPLDGEECVYSFEQALEPFSESRND